MSFGGFLGSIVSGVLGQTTQAVGGLASNIIGSVTSGLGSAGSQLINSATPVLTSAVNSQAASVLAGNLGGGGIGGLLGAATGNSTNSQGDKIVNLNKVEWTFWKKLFNFYKIDANGRYILENGQMVLNWGKVIGFSVGVLTGGLLLFKVVLPKLKGGSKWR